MEVKSAVNLLNVNFRRGKMIMVTLKNSLYKVYFLKLLVQEQKGLFH